MSNLVQVRIYDTTLRDGSQAEGISFSKTDKVRIAEALDNFGVSYIEGGWPGSNPKDISFFDAAKKIKWKNAKIAAFGSTRRFSNPVEQDDNIKKLLESEAPAVTIFGKSWLLHVSTVLKITPEQNIQIIADSCAYLASHEREVIFDAEHFFDGYKDDPDYAKEILKTAVKNGAKSVVLCDTNGGTLASQISAICSDVILSLPKDIIIGIHCHNDSDLAVANSISAVEAGIKHVQGTINGYGERCGNTNLCSIIPALELKMGMKTLLTNNISKLKELSVFVDDIANVRPNHRLPYVGESSFAHKGGMHVNAVDKNPITFEHVDPSKIGNKRRILVSDLAGKTNIINKISEHKLEQLSNEEIVEVLAELKRMENEGYEYEAASASFTLLMNKATKKFKPNFYLEGYRVIVEKRGHSEPCLTEATVKVNVDKDLEIMAAEGDGPVNALDKALRKALERFFPEISAIRLTDYKVRILEGENSTSAKTRVLIETTDGTSSWSTVGVSENIIEASWEALVDSVEYFLQKKGK
ncbi:MAG TPA: citramalate synthase [Lentisphaeria bacterium]|nr:MAG: citramalate synthase [Lentisphaerae bacterium GWF2_38_69]HBM16482.1 citramalate synthase [Lentisphaeria bacterium]